MPNSNLVLGVEADASWLTSDGTNTCLAFSGFFVSANCRAQPNMMGDLTARVGWAYGQFNHSLFYVKGGAAFVHNQIDITTNAHPRLWPCSSHYELKLHESRLDGWGWRGTCDNPRLVGET